MEIVLGTAQLFGRYGVAEQSVASSGDDPKDFLLLAQSLGFSAIDTAPSYFNAEEAIGGAKLSLPIHTKLESSLNPVQSITGSLARLRRNSVEIAYLHDPEAPTKDEGAAIQRASSLIGTLTAALGASVYTTAACRAAIANDLITVVQIPVNPLKRDVLNVAASGRTLGKKVFGRSLFGQGLLVATSGQLPTRLSHLASTTKAFHRLCQELGRTPAEICLLWARDHPQLDGLVIGLASLQQLRETSEALKLPPLHPSERDAVDGLDFPDPECLDPRSW